MYYVRVEHSDACRSTHRETPEGLLSATAEADMRTHATGHVHIVTDSNYYKLYTALPKAAGEPQSLTGMRWAPPAALHEWPTVLLLLAGVMLWLAFMR